MIDTLRFKAKGSEEIYKNIKNSGIERVIWDYAENEQKHVLVYQLVPVPNKDYKIYVQAQDYEHFFIEFSLPKILFGTNIFMIYPKQFATTLIEVYRLIRNFLNLPIEPIDNWIIQRVDYCYVWKFVSQDYALWVLQNLAKYQYPRKGITLRDTSIEIAGTSERMIFYLKHDEYLAKTFRNLSKTQPLLANYLLEQSKGTLRFEIVQKKSKLTSLYGREVTYKDILTEENIKNTLNSVLKTFCNTDYLVPMTWYEATDLIYSNLQGREAFNLFGFMNMWYHFDLAVREYNRAFLKKNISPSTIYKNKQKLKEIGVGILFTNPDFKAVDLAIHSSNVINKEDDVAGIAKAIRDLLIL
jgi:hypothetical protein